MTEKKQTGVNVLLDRLKKISARPGVYRMLDENGTVLYVGKAKNLKKRLTNYTHLDKLSTRIRQMVYQVADLIVIETAGETEALLLENDLIKQYRPFYNILLKDDKSFPYILITKDDIPRIHKYRGAKNIKGDYFGPFANGLAVNRTLTEIQKVFGLRTCPNSYFCHRTRPCLLYQIGRCTGPCCGCISKEDYLIRVKQTKDFLKGERTKIQDDLVARMHQLSKEQRYEEAIVLRDKIQSTDAQGFLGDQDIIALYRENDTACVQVFFYRSDKATGNIFHMISHVEDMDSSDILSAFIVQFYDSIPAPKNIYTSHAVPPGLADALAQKHQHAIKIASGPFRGTRKKLMDQALINAQTTYRQQTNSQEVNARVWDELRVLLGLKELKKIEIYDNSHIQGTAAVGAMVAADVNGFQKKWYRRFNITGLYKTDPAIRHAPLRPMDKEDVAPVQSIPLQLSEKTPFFPAGVESNSISCQKTGSANLMQPPYVLPQKCSNEGETSEKSPKNIPDTHLKPTDALLKKTATPAYSDCARSDSTPNTPTLERFNDDFGMMREVLMRRLKRGRMDNDLPSAMLIDGGKGQLSSVQQIFEELGVTGIALMAVAKGPMRNAGKETLFLSTDPTPIHLDEKSDLQHLIQRLRDEAHRFAIGSHRQKRAKNMFHETLKDIEGIGDKRKKDLMVHFGSVREIAGASVASLMRVPGINEKIAKKIYTFYHG